MSSLETEDYHCMWNDLWMRLRREDKNCVGMIYKLLFDDESFWPWVVQHYDKVLQGMLRLPFVLSRIVQHEQEDWMVPKFIWKHVMDRIINHSSSNQQCIGMFLRELLVHHGAYETVSSVSIEYLNQKSIEHSIVDPPLPPRVWAKYICTMLQNHPENFVEKAKILLQTLPSNKPIWKRTLVQNVILSPSRKDSKILVDWLHSTVIAVDKINKDSNSSDEESDFSECGDNTWLNFILDQVLEAWSESSFVRYQNMPIQTNTTEFLQEAFSKCIVQEQILPLYIQGISIRLSSHSKLIRNHGLKMAYIVSLQTNGNDRNNEDSKIFQQLLEEDSMVEQQNSKLHVENDNDYSKSKETGSSTSVMSRSRRRIRKTKIKLKKVDPDEEFNSSDDDEVEEIFDEDSVEHQIEYTDSDPIIISSRYNQQHYTEAIAGIDTEEDLSRAPRPLYLKQALDMLINDNDDMWYQEAALIAIPEIMIKFKDYPLQLVINGFVQVLHMENKFDFPRFDEWQWDALTSLACWNNDHVTDMALYIICKELFQTSCSQHIKSLMFQILHYMALSLSGNKMSYFSKEKNSITSRRDNPQSNLRILPSSQRSSGKRSLVPRQDSPKTSRWGKLSINNDSKVRSNHFGPVAHIWLTTMLRGVQNNTEWELTSWVWSQVLYTSSKFVEYSENYTTTHLIAAELLDFVMGFDLLGDFSFNEEELTLALMCTMNSCLPLILNQTIPLRLYDTIFPYLEKVSSSHSHESCRQLASDLVLFLSKWMV